MSTPAPSSTPSAANPDIASPQFDPVALAESMASAAEKSAKLLGDFAARQDMTGRNPFADELGLGKAFMELAANMFSNPAKLARRHRCGSSTRSCGARCCAHGRRPIGSPSPRRATKRFRTRAGRTTCCSTTSSRAT
jgi:hypothetical protein